MEGLRIAKVLGKVPGKSYEKKFQGEVLGKSSVKSGDMFGKHDGKKKKFPGKVLMIKFVNMF